MGFPILVRQHLYIESLPWSNPGAKLFHNPAACCLMLCDISCISACRGGPCRGSPTPGETLWWGLGTRRGSVDTDKMLALLAASMESSYSLLCSKQYLLARWLTSARAYRIGGRKLCPSVCLYVKRYLLLQFCTDYNQTWINMIWAVAAKTLLSQIFHNWRRIEVNCVYISHCKWYRTSAGMPACIPNRRCCAGQCAGQ